MRYNTSVEFASKESLFASFDTSDGIFEREALEDDQSRSKIARVAAENKDGTLVRQTIARTRTSFASLSPSFSFFFAQLCALRFLVDDRPL